MTIYDSICRLKSPYDKKTLLWELTNKCLLSCKHCMVSAGELFSDIDCGIQNVVSLGIERVVLSGGDPLLHPDIYNIIKTLSVTYMADTILICNGMHMNNKSLKLLHDSGLKRIAISLDGPCREIHESIRGLGAFKSALDAIKLSRKYFHTSVSIVVLPQNHHLIISILEMLQELEIPSVSINSYIPVPGKDDLNEWVSKHSFTALQNQITNFRSENANIKVKTSGIFTDCKYACPAGNYFWYLSADNNIYTCPLAQNYNFLSKADLQLPYSGKCSALEKILERLPL